MSGHKKIRSKLWYSAVHVKKHLVLHVYTLTLTRESHQIPRTAMQDESEKAWTKYDEVMPWRSQPVAVQRQCHVFSVQNTQHIGPQNTQRFCPLPRSRHVSIPFPATLSEASSRTSWIQWLEFLLGKKPVPIERWQIIGLENSVANSIFTQWGKRYVRR
jgi:hypothetical protein